MSRHGNAGSGASVRIGRAVEMAEPDPSADAAPTAGHERTARDRRPDPLVPPVRRCSAMSHVPWLSLVGAVAHGKSAPVTSGGVARWADSSPRTGVRFDAPIVLPAEVLEALPRVTVGHTRGGGDGRRPSGDRGVAG